MPAAKPPEFRRRAVERPVAVSSRSPRSPRTSTSPSRACAGGWIGPTSTKAHKEGLSSTEKRELVEPRRRIRVSLSVRSHITMFYGALVRTLGVRHVGRRNGGSFDGRQSELPDHVHRELNGVNGSPVSPTVVTRATQYCMIQPTWVMARTFRSCGEHGHRHRPDSGSAQVRSGHASARQSGRAPARSPAPRRRFGGRCDQLPSHDCHAAERGRCAACGGGGADRDRAVGRAGQRSCARSGSDVRRLRRDADRGGLALRSNPDLAGCRGGGAAVRGHVCAARRHAYRWSGDDGDEHGWIQHHTGRGVVLSRPRRSNGQSHLVGSATPAATLPPHGCTAAAAAVSEKLTPTYDGQVAGGAGAAGPGLFATMEA